MFNFVHSAVGKREELLKWSWKWWRETEYACALRVRLDVMPISIRDWTRLLELLFSPLQEVWMDPFIGWIHGKDSRWSAQRPKSFKLARRTMKQNLCRRSLFSIMNFPILQLCSSGRSTELFNEVKWICAIIKSGNFIWQSRMSWRCNRTNYSYFTPEAHVMFFLSIMWMTCDFSIRR